MAGWRKLISVLLIGSFMLSVGGCTEPTITATAVVAPPQPEDPPTAIPTDTPTAVPTPIIDIDPTSTPLKTSFELEPLKETKPLILIIDNSVSMERAVVEGSSLKCDPEKMRYQIGLSILNSLKNMIAHDAFSEIELGVYFIGDKSYYDSNSNFNEAVGKPETLDSLGVETMINKITNITTNPPIEPKDKVTIMNGKALESLLYIKSSHILYISDGDHRMNNKIDDQPDAAKWVEVEKSLNKLSESNTVDVLLLCSEYLHEGDKLNWNSHNYSGSKFHVWGLPFEIDDELLEEFQPGCRKYAESISTDTSNLTPTPPSTPLSNTEKSELHKQYLILGFCNFASSFSTSSEMDIGDFDIYFDQGSDPELINIEKDVISIFWFFQPLLSKEYEYAPERPSLVITNGGSMKEHQVVPNRKCEDLEGIFNTSGTNLSKSTDMWLIWRKKVLIEPLINIPQNLILKDELVLEFAPSLTLNSVGKKSVDWTNFENCYSMKILSQSLNNSTIESQGFSEGAFLFSLNSRDLNFSEISFGQPSLQMMAELNRQIIENENKNENENSKNKPSTQFDLPFEFSPQVTLPIWGKAPTNDITLEMDIKLLNYWGDKNKTNIEMLKFNFVGGDGCNENNMQDGQTEPAKITIEPLSEEYPEQKVKLVITDNSIPKNCKCIHIKLDIVPTKPEPFPWEDLDQYFTLGSAETESEIADLSQCK